MVGDEQVEAFNPEQLLSLIIDKIKEYNKMATETSLENNDANGNEAALE